MDLFTFRKMEEDHYTNILMYILSTNSYSLLQLFLKKLFPKESENFVFEDLGIRTFSKRPPQLGKEKEYIIGIAPYANIQTPSELENNMDSIPDGWIFGRNFNLLFEFKIRGTLDDAQLAAHRKILKNYTGTIKRQWRDVIEVLEQLQSEGDEIQRFLISEFIKCSKQFISKRRASGMPKGIISGKAAKGKLYFRITGSKETGVYSIDVIFPDESEERLKSDLTGIQEARRWIANYVMKNYHLLSINEVTEKTVITDFCVKPGRIKNAWNQWRLGSYL